MTIETYLDLARREFDTSATLVTSEAGVPEHWKDYLGETAAERLVGVRLELRKLEPYFPKTSAGLAQICIDAFLVQTKARGLCRILVRQLNGEIYLAYSRAPLNAANAPLSGPVKTLKARAPKAFSWVYENLMDGLVDSYGLTGFVPSDLLYAMSDQEAYADFDWYDDFAKTRNPDLVLEVFSSGGGGYLLLDLNDDLGTVMDPQALRIAASPASWTPQNTVDFWPFLDGWMAIGLTEN